jgi:hypothetical protein
VEAMRDQHEPPTDDFEIADPIESSDYPDDTPGDLPPEVWEEENTDDPVEDGASEEGLAASEDGEEPFSHAG